MIKTNPTTTSNKNRGRLLVATLGLLLLIVAGISCISLSNTMVPSGIVIHHSAIPFLLGTSSSDVDFISRVHKARGYGAFYWGKMYYVGYHFLILQDGTVIEGRPQRLKGAHTLHHPDYLGICLLGYFSSKENPNGALGPQTPSEAQLNSLARLIATLRAKHRIAQDKSIPAQEAKSIN